MKKSVFFIFLGVFLCAQVAAEEAWSLPQRLTWGGSSYRADIIVDSAGTVHLAYETNIFGNLEIVYRNSTDEGATWSPIKRITWNSGESTWLELTADGSKNLHLTWNDKTPGQDEVYYRKSTDSGSTWGPLKRLTWNSGDSIWPHPAVDSGNRVHVVWEDNSPGNGEIYYKRSTDGGSTWGALTRLTWSSGETDYPSIAVDSTDTIHVIYNDNTPGTYEIFYKKSTNNGVSWLPPKRITWNSFRSWEADLVVDSSDNLHIVWDEKRGGIPDIYHKRSTDGGNTWLGLNRLTWNTGSSEYPAVSASPVAGDIQIIWHDTTPGNYDIFYKESGDYGVSWGILQRLTWTSGSSLIPDVAAGSKIHACWWDDSTGSYCIYYKNK